MAQAAADERLLTFRVGEERFGVTASLVREVGLMPRLTHVPHAPANLLGLGNFRGQVLPILSFGNSDHAQREQRVILLGTTSPIALAVDEVTELAADTGLDAIDVERLLQNTLPKALSPSGGDRRHVTAITVGRGGATSASIAATRPSETHIPLVAFAIANQEFALPIEAVEEILPVPDHIAVLPHSDAVVVGSVTVAGMPLRLLSLAALLALPMTTAARRHILVVRIAIHRVGLVVDAMRGVLRVAESRIDPVPPVLTRGSAEARIQAICRLDHGQRLISVLAVEHLLRAGLTAQSLQATVAEPTVAPKAAPEAADQFLIFQIGDSKFGLPIGAVIEVATLPAKLAPLPKTPPFVRGVMSLRGNAVPVIDQSLRFIGTAASGARQRVVVVRNGVLVAGFLVDAVIDVRRLALAALRPAPEFSGENTRVFEGVAPGTDGAAMVLIISPQDLLDGTTSELLAASSKTAG